MSRASKIAPAVRIRQSPPLLPPASRRGFFFNRGVLAARPGAEVAEMGSNRPPSLSSVGLRGPPAMQMAGYARRRTRCAVRIPYHPLVTSEPIKVLVGSHLVDLLGSERELSGTN